MSVRNIIWIASYPKSGNTWVGSALEVAGIRFGYPPGTVDAYVLRGQGKQPVVNEAVAPALRQDAPCSVLKTHSRYSPDGQPHWFKPLELRTAAYIHIYRNPLDVLLSYIGFTRLEYRDRRDRDYRQMLFRDLLGFDEVVSYVDWQERNIDNIPQKNLDHALDRFSETGLAIPTLLPMSGSWTEHLESWLATPPDLPGYSIKYEDCLADPATFDPLAELFTFAPADLRHAVGFVNKRARTVSTEGTGDQAIFYNKMRSYYFQEYFSKAAISRFCRQNEDTLKRFGYASILDVA